MWSCSGKTDKFTDCHVNIACSEQLAASWPLEQRKKLKSLLHQLNYVWECLGFPVTFIDGSGQNRYRM